MNKQRKQKTIYIVLVLLMALMMQVHQPVQAMDITVGREDNFGTVNYPGGYGAGASAGFDPDTPAPDVADVPAPDADDVPAPDAADVPAPDADNVPAPDADDVPAPDADDVPAPEMLQATVVWEEGSDQPASFTSNAEFADFSYVTVDGEIVDEADYEVKEGSIIVTFKPRFLAALSAGSHPVEIVSKIGGSQGEARAKGVLVIKEKAQVTPTSAQATPSTQPSQATETLPRTGESSGLNQWLIVLLLSAGGLLYAARKKRLSKQ
ncbi:MAG TPA: LPXTG cell wall anchor domain-containing protein [Clostridiaceae bacterium]|nr:LPXTG cell wall anchor domain-containing protein [Clostridiaceae bacterium]